MGLPVPKPLGEGGPDLHYFLLGDDAFALTPRMVKPDSRRQLTRKKRIADYRIPRGRKVVEHAFGILVSRFWGLLDTMEQSPKVIRHYVYMCGVTQHAEDTPGRGRQGTSPKEMMEQPYKMNNWFMCLMTTTGILPGKAKHR